MVKVINCISRFIIMSLLLSYSRLHSNSDFLDKYQIEPATVRFDSSLCKEEKMFLTMRELQTRKSCDMLLPAGLELSQPTPKIAICFSGGGYRAMIETIGFLMGAQLIGLLDATTYMAGLSGSTWALTSWVYSGLTIEEYFKQLTPKINRYFSSYALYLSAEERQHIYDARARKVADGKSFGLVDIYGALLANTLLDGFTQNKQDVCLSDLAPKLFTGKYPLPLCTAVTGGVGNHHLWFEFSPYEIGCSEIGFIPTWSFGRSFKNGISEMILPNTYAPQVSLGYCMGIWGSAFAVDGERLQHEFGGIDTQTLQTINSILSTYSPYISSYTGNISNYINYNNATWAMNALWPDTNQNFAAANIPNFAHNMQRPGFWNWWSQKQAIELAHNKELSLIDGGFDLLASGYSMNLGIMPLLRKERNIDIIIICDSSACLEGAPSLHAAEERARGMNLKFPKIDYADVDKRIISVFEDHEDKSTPTVIYMPGIKNDNYGAFDPSSALYTSTVNFCYTPEQILELAGLISFNIQESSSIIINAINRNVKKRQSSWWF